MREEQKKQPKATNCDFCHYFHEDEDTGLAVCHMALDAGSDEDDDEEEGI